MQSFPFKHLRLAIFLALKAASAKSFLASKFNIWHCLHNLNVATYINGNQGTLLKSPFSCQQKLYWVQRVACAQRYISAVPQRNNKSRHISWHRGGGSGGEPFGNGAMKKPASEFPIS
jgi:hypothetical protein